MIRQAVVQFEVGRILVKIRVFRRLQTVKLIEELKVQYSQLGDGGIVRVEGQLSQQWPRIANPAERQ
jgi:hypothetical protein